MTRTDEEYADIEAKSRTRRDYRGYVTAASIDHIAERCIRLARSGRRMTLIEYIGPGKPYRVDVGLVIDKGARLPVEHRPGLAFHVHLSNDSGHNWRGFGAHTEDRFPTLRAVHEEQERIEAFRKSRGEDASDVWDMLDPQIRHLTYVEVTGGLDGWGDTREDHIKIEYINEHGVRCGREVWFDRDALRAAPYPRVYDFDSADAGHAECVLDAAPAVTRWAVVKDLCDRLGDDAGPAVWGEYAALDVEVRPWAHGGGDES